jgi:hypothetical protein
LVIWSGALGLFNLTLALLLTAQPPNLWIGLSAGTALLALVDGSQRFAYLKLCQVEPGVLASWLGMFMRITGLSLVAGLVLVLLVMLLPQQGAAAAGLLTIIGAGLFVAGVAMLLLYGGALPKRE